MNFFIKKFPSTEWSGPAWYKPTFKKGEKFPSGFRLMHFHPVDLGHGTATTIEAGDTAKILQSTWDNYPETEKCMMGIIHSHHGMGAFFSGTDEKCLEDNAPMQNFYCSTVVASKKERYAFGISYTDQYDNAHVYEAKSNDIKVEMPKDKDHAKWSRIAKKIEAKKPAPISYGYIRNGGDVNQSNLWNLHNFNENLKTEISDGLKENEEVITLNKYSTDTENKLINRLREEADTQVDPDSAFVQSLYEAFNKKELLYDTFVEELRDWGLNPNVVMNELQIRSGNDTKTLTK